MAGEEASPRYRSEKTTSRRLVYAQQQSYERDNVVFDEGLVEERVEHRGAEDGAGGERKSEHVRYVRAAFLLTLQKSMLVHLRLFQFSRLMKFIAIYLLHLAQVKRVFVVSPELHKSHVGAL